jgi:hypothetical protein
MPFKESYTNQPRMDLFLHKEHTAKKENDIFLIYMEIQMGSIAKSYMKKN